MNTMDMDRTNAARQRRETVPRKHEAEHPDDIGVELAPRVTPQQLTELFALGCRGPTPSTEAQAEALLQQWRRSGAPSTEPAAPQLAKASQMQSLEAGLRQWEPEAGEYT